MSITGETVKNLLLDAGVVYVNYGLGDDMGERVLGATEGGNTFLVEREVREIPVDGARGKVKGLRRIVREDAKLTVNMKEMSAENIRLALSGAEVSDYPEEEEKTHDEIRSTGEITDDDYVDNVALVATLSGSDTPVVCIVENALSDGNFEIGAEDKDEAVVPVEFSAHFDVEDMGKTPWAIRYPVMEKEESEEPSDVTTIKTTDSGIVLGIVNTEGMEAITVAGGTTCDDLLEVIDSTDGSVQSYEITDDSGVTKSGEADLVDNDILKVTSESGKEEAEYTITVSL